MQNLEEIAAEIEEDLDEKDTIREIALKSSRALIRLSGAAVRTMHNEEDPSSLLAEAKDEASKLKSLVIDHSDLGSAGYVEDAYQELAEAFLFYSIMRERNLPSPRDLEITSTSYLLGMGDVIGELRRASLDSLRRGDVNTAVLRLEQMETLYETIIRFSYPNALVAIRRKQDVARALIEKTRGEVTIAVRSKRLEDHLENVWKDVKAVQKKQKNGK